MVRRFTKVGLLLGCVLAGACSGSQTDDGIPDALEGTDEDSAREARELRGQCQRGDREVTYDLNHDGATDIREVYTGSTIVCRETDLNFDGRVEIYRYFEDGRQRREEMDLDRDGRLDLVSIFAPDGQEVTREEYDTNYDSRIDVWRYFQSGQVQRVERDSDHDGRADVWTHCAAGRATRLEFDTDGDGNPDDSRDLDEEDEVSECVRGELVEAAPAEDDEPPASPAEGDGEEG